MTDDLFTASSTLTTIPCEPSALAFGYDPRDLPLDHSIRRPTAHENARARPAQVRNPAERMAMAAAAGSPDVDKHLGTRSSPLYPQGTIGSRPLQLKKPPFPPIPISLALPIERYPNPIAHAGRSCFHPRRSRDPYRRRRPSSPSGAWRV